MVKVDPSEIKKLPPQKRIEELNKLEIEVHKAKEEAHRQIKERIIEEIEDLRQIPITRTIALEEEQNVPRKKEANIEEILSEVKSKKKEAAPDVNYDPIKQQVEVTYSGRNAKESAYLGKNDDQLYGRQNDLERNSEPAYQSQEHDRKKKLGIKDSFYAE